MNNSMLLVEKIFDHVENDEIDKAVFCCMRLSRKIGDIFNLIMFMRELSLDKEQFNNSFYDETLKLKEEARKFLYETTRKHWLEERALDYSITGDSSNSVVKHGAGEIQKEIDDILIHIEDYNVPQGMGEFDTAAFTDSYTSVKARLRLKKSALITVKDRIRSRCFNYASRIEKQLELQNNTISFLGEIQNNVNNYFAIISEETFSKLKKALSLIGSDDIEDHALLLTSIRRAIASVADFFYPPQKGEVECCDGIKRMMGKDQYLNRLHEFCFSKFSSSTSNELIRAELEQLMTFAKKLNNIASKGVHAEVTALEAKQGLVGLYLFLSNMIDKLQLDHSL
ncbi:MAG: hypothetical protein D3903_01015 [Candidatus Electrothrix sp. GM3_4]|nr:hypothetical protein [Candidatus Electrothrix sp. GM3_4]